jgi:ribosomal protein L37AE/L43A
MSEIDDVKKLLRLKRYEQPPPGYYQRFAEEFKERQRAELLCQSARGLLVERITTWMWSGGTRRWIYAGGATGALVAAGFYFGPAVFSDAPPKSAAKIAETSAATNPEEAKKEPDHSRSATTAPRSPAVSK